MSYNGPVKDPLLPRSPYVLSSWKEVSECIPEGERCTISPCLLLFVLVVVVVVVDRQPSFLSNQPWKQNWQHDEKKPPTPLSQFCLSFLIKLVKVELTTTRLVGAAPRQRPGGSNIRHIRPPYWEVCDLFTACEGRGNSPQCPNCCVWVPSARTANR